MIRGYVTAQFDAVIQLVIYGNEGQIETVPALIDTGFNGSLSLPPALIKKLRLPFRRRGRAILADGSESIFDVYEGEIMWDSRKRRIPIDEANTDCLIGMRLLRNYEMLIQVVNDGDVILTPLTLPPVDLA